MNKKGESIVEVVVACGILTILFAAVSTMIMGAVGLNTDARQRMEAVSLAQTQLNNFIVTGGNADGLHSGSCTLSSAQKFDINPVASGDGGCQGLDSYTDLVNHLTTTGKTECDYVSVRALQGGELQDPATINRSNFYIVESYVRWIDKGGAEKYVVQKLVNK